jgi:hypothetical protein
MAQLPSMCAALLALLLVPSPVRADVTVKGRVFYDSPQPSFTFEATVKAKDGKIHNESRYFDMAGKLLIEEEADLEGEKLTRYVYQQKQTGDFGDATFEGGKIQMNYTEGGQTSKDTDTYDPSTVVAPMIQPLLAKHWDELMKDESIKVRYLAIERTDTIGFKFFKDQERVLNGKPVVDILMKPSSFFIAALVSPVRITMLKDAPHWIVETNGRTPIRVPKTQPPVKRSDWKAIDARVEYEVPKP